MYTFMLHQPCPQLHTYRLPCITTTTTAVRTTASIPDTTGMNSESYFLSFARLARRSAVFWGHAVTSGVSAFDALSSRHDDNDGDDRDDRRYTTEAGRDSGRFGDDSREAGDDLGGTTTGGDDRAHGLAGNLDQVGGVDYFVSSWLFEDKRLGRRAQRKYSER